MASFGRTKLMAVAIKRFLTQLQRHDPNAYATLPQDLRQRYEPRRRGSSPTPRTPKPAPAAASKPPRTSASSSTASLTVATSRTVRPIKL